MFSSFPPFSLDHDFSCWCVDWFCSNLDFVVFHCMAQCQVSRFVYFHDMLQVRYILQVNIKLGALSTLMLLGYRRRGNWRSRCLRRAPLMRVLRQGEDFVGRCAACLETHHDLLQWIYAERSCSVWTKHRAGMLVKSYRQYMCVNP